MRMWIGKHWAIGVVLACVCFGCGYIADPYVDRLVCAEQQLAQVPDSVYAWLCTLEQAELAPSERAMYLLLRTEAEDKLYVEHTTDSLIAIARAYFEKEKDLPHLAKAWYLTGRIHSDWEQWEQAMQDFLKAEVLTEDSEDYALRARIAYHLGNVCFSNRVYDTAQDNYKEAYAYFRHTTDSVNIAYTLKNIGKSFLPFQKTDSIVFYYEAALDIAEAIRNEEIQSVVYRNLGYVYIDMRQYDQALFYMKRALELNPLSVPYSIFADLGKLYTKMGQLDSAKFYLRQILDYPDPSARYMGYKYLAEVAEQEKDPETALRYKAQENLLRDSIEQSKKTESVLTLLHQHKQQTLEQGLLKTLSRMNWLYGGLLAGGIGLTIYLIVRLYGRIRWKRRQLMLYKTQWQERLSDIRRNEAQIEKYGEVIRTNRERWKRLLEQIVQENREIDMLKEQLEAIRTENQQLVDQLHQMAIQECRQHPFLQSLYDARKPQSVFTSAQWKHFDKAFDWIFPGYRQRFEQACPDLPLNYRQICYLVLLDLKLSRIAEIMGLQTNTLSVYKNTIKKKYLNHSGDASLELLLRRFLN